MQRRLFERIEIPLKIRYELVKNPPNIKNATSEDISGGGIRLALDECLEIGANVKLEIEIPGEANKSTVAYGKVVWVSKPRQIVGGLAMTYYDTGIQFFQADPISIGKIFKRYFEKK
ncbi:MAG: PilZ domain-containing protein [Candidatus Omnitrophota bacterium]